MLLSNEVHERKERGEESVNDDAADCAEGKLPRGRSAKVKSEGAFGESLTLLAAELACCPTVVFIELITDSGGGRDDEADLGRGKMCDRGASNDDD